jgi:hypothetical protein
MNESEAWRAITGIDRTDARLSHVKAKVSELAATVGRLTDGRTASSEWEGGMEESRGASGDIDLVSRVRGVLEELGLRDAQVVAEMVALYRDHPRWAVWLPMPGGQWEAARPAGSRPPSPEVPMIWVHADTAAGLADQMRGVDGQLVAP